MSKINNVVFATTTNGNESNNNNNNVEMNNPQVEKVESVEVGKPAAKYVVNGGQELWMLKEGVVFHGSKRGTRDFYKIVIITDKRVVRNAIMVDFIQIEYDHAISYADYDNPIYAYKCKKYHKKVEWMGKEDEQVRIQWVNGVNGVFAMHEIDSERIKNSSFWNHGVFRMDEDMYNEWGELVNKYLSAYGLKAVMVCEEKKESQIKKVANEIVDYANKLNDKTVCVRWVMDGKFSNECLIGEVGYDDNHRLVFRLHDNFIERHGTQGTVVMAAGADREWHFNKYDEKQALVIGSCVWLAIKERKNYIEEPKSTTLEQF